MLVGEGKGELEDVPVLAGAAGSISSSFGAQVPSMVLGILSENRAVYI